MSKPCVAKGPQKTVKIKKELKSKKTESMNDVKVTATTEKRPSHKLDPTFIGNVTKKGTTKETNLADKNKINRSDLVAAEKPKKDIAKPKINNETEILSSKTSKKLSSKTKKNQESEVRQTESVAVE